MSNDLSRAMMKDRNGVNDNSNSSSVQERVKLLNNDFRNHKFRKGEYYDRYLDKLLIKYNVTLSDYYKYSK